MNPSLDLKTIERRAWRSVHQDGLFDMYLGLVLLAFGGMMLLERTGVGEAATLAVYAGLLLGGVWAMRIAKQRITIPRIGVATFSAPRRVKRRKGVFVLGASVAVGLLAWTLVAVRPDDAAAVGALPYVFFANAVIVFGLLAFYLDLPRLTLYGIFFGAPILTRELRGGGPPDPAVMLFIGFGVVALAIGGGLLVRFIHTYPATEAEATDG